MPKNKTKNIFDWTTWEVQSENEIWPIYVILQEENFYQKILQKLRPETSFRLFCVCKELSTTSVRKLNFWSNLLITESEEVHMLILTNFDSSLLHI